MLEFMIQHAKTTPKSFGYRLNNGLVTLENQEEALTSPKWAYEFARNVTGADIEVCQGGAIKDPGWAYNFARYVKGAN